MTAREAAAAMTMVTMRVEKRHHVVAFSDRLVDIRIDEKMKMDEVIRTMSNVSLNLLMEFFFICHSILRELKRGIWWPFDHCLMQVSPVQVTVALHLLHRDFSLNF